MADVVEGRDIALDLALSVLAQVRAEAERGGFLLAVCVADRAGNPVASARMDGAPLGAYAVACDKAYSSAIWGDRTGAMGTAAQPGGEDFGIAGALGGRMIVFAGGVPIRRQGELIGGLGVSGARSPEDEAVALAALAALGLEG